MRIRLNSLIQSAKGPYGGPANRLKMQTLQDGSVIVVPRKRAMTGDRDNPLHAWSRLHWIAVDAYWRSLPRRIRTEWGKCTKRTSVKSRSALDEFRSVNVTRAILGFPILRLPPDRFNSHAHYLERPPATGRRNRRAPLQVWIQGQEKPEPPWVPGDPLDPTPPPEPPPEEGKAFDIWHADEPNAIIPSPICINDVCPDWSDWCHDTAVSYMPTDFEPRMDHSWLQWEAAWDEGEGHQEAVWQSKREIHSLRVWYDNVPYETIIASHLECQTDQWWGTDIPWGAAWCIRLKYNCPPGVKLSWGYYWQANTVACPRGPFTLAWKDDVYGTYPWPDHIMIDPTGAYKGDPPPCPDLYALLTESPVLSGFWMDFAIEGNWCGLSWTLDTAHQAAKWPSHAHGPALGSYSDIHCCSTGPRAGFWWFTLVVNHKAGIWPLEYRKPSYHVTGGPLGHYFLWDPADDLIWAPPAIQVWEEQIDWHKRDPNRPYAIAKDVTLFLALQLAASVGFMYCRRFLIRYGLLSRNPYTYQAIRQAARHSAPAAQSLSSGAWKCRAFKDYTTSLARNKWMAGEAWRRVHLGIKATPPWVIPPVVP